MIGLIGKKVGMTRFFGQNGESIQVTAILADPCHVVQVKTKQKEGYGAVQLGAFARRKKLISRPQQGHFAKAKVEPKAKLAEFRVANTDIYQPGQELRVDIFEVGDRIKVTGTSKGKGFAGGVKRWGFRGGPKTHGQSDRHRAPGSLGGSSYPSRVWKGQKMAGRMGGDRVSVRNLEVVQVDLENNILLVRGAVPGARNSTVLIQRTTELDRQLPVADKVTETKKQKQAAKESSPEGAAAGTATSSADEKKSAHKRGKAKDKAESPSAADAKAAQEESPDQQLKPKDNVSQDVPTASQEVDAQEGTAPTEDIEE